MFFKKLGNSDLEISSIGLGTGYNFCKKKDVELIKLVKSALDLGINFFDTAEVYFDGHSEEILGEAIRGMRIKAIIATKFCPENSSRGKLIKALDNSLKRLRSDYVDLYQVHWPSLSVPLEETLATLESQVKKGKIRYIGVSNFSLKKIRTTVKNLKDTPLSSVQNEYNFSERGVERDVLPYCEKKNITFIAYNPLGTRFPLNNKDQAKLLSRLAKKYGKNEAQIVLRWLTSRSNVVAIPSTTSLKHLRENAKSTSFSLEERDLDLFDKAFEQKMTMVPIKKIEVIDDGNTYLSPQEAIQNSLSFVPSPLELSKEIKAGDFLKPIKLKKVNDKGRFAYQLSGGKIRFWGWVIAYGDKKPIPAVIE